MSTFSSPEPVSSPAWLWDPAAPSQEDYASVFRAVSSRADDHFAVKHCYVDPGRRFRAKFQLLLFAERAECSIISLHWDSQWLVGTTLSAEELFRIGPFETTLTAGLLRERLAESLSGRLALFQEGHLMGDDEACSNSDDLVVKRFPESSLDPVGNIRAFSGGSMVAEIKLLPGWLNFLWGMVDVDLEASCLDRSYMLEWNGQWESVRKDLVAQSLSALKTMAESPDYNQFYQCFGWNLKLGAIEDGAGRAGGLVDGAALSQLMGLLRFQTSMSGGELVPLQDYLDRMKDDQKHILCAVGSSAKSLLASPSIESYLGEGLEIILMDDDIDGDLLDRLLLEPEFEYALGIHPMSGPHFLELNIQG